MTTLRARLARLLSRARAGGASHAPARERTTQGATSARYPGDYTGTPQMTYAPRPDGRPDPGEIVWTWVPYEEDHLRGKDRPVLIIGRDRDWLLGLMLTSKDHNGAPARRDLRPRWVDIGAGPWDRRGRPSEVRVDRILRVDPEAIRREGATLDEQRFLVVADAVRAAR